MIDIAEDRLACLERQTLAKTAQYFGFFHSDAGVLDHEVTLIVGCRIMARAKHLLGPGSQNLEHYLDHAVQTLLGQLLVRCRLTEQCSPHPRSFAYVRAF